MSAINSKNDICNMTLSHLGNRNSVNNIDTPKTDPEKAFALWYDITRQTSLKLLMPNFSIGRMRVGLKVTRTDENIGYKYGYEYPARCLKVLGIGMIDQKNEVPFTIESNLIWVDDLYEDGLPIRFIDDIKDVSKMSPEFKVQLSFDLAPNVALPITQDVNKAALVLKQLPAKMASLTALNAQENMPIRISRSKFKQARYGAVSSNPSKK